MGKVTLADVLELSIPERIRLVEDIWDSIAAVPDAVPLTEEEKREIDRRLDDHYRNPREGTPWEEVKAWLLGRK